jgi:hypothetical protein
MRGGLLGRGRERADRRRGHAHWKKKGLPDCMSSRSGVAGFPLHLLPGAMHSLHAAPQRLNTERYGWRDTERQVVDATLLFLMLHVFFALQMHLAWVRSLTAEFASFRCGKTGMHLRWKPVPDNSMQLTTPERHVYTFLES